MVRADKCVGLGEGLVGGAKGNLAGFFSIRVNDQYRIVFRFEHGDAREVQICDYH